MEKSIFSELFSTVSLEDRYTKENDKSIGVDVIIPLLNSNELFERNLYNYYSVIPIRRLIIGDGGCTDPSIEIACKFPRVEIIDQRKYKSQGYAIKELMESVTAEYFIYLHADVFLPPDWFDVMYRYKDEYDWFECNRRMTTLLEYESKLQNNSERALSGSQFGRKETFGKILSVIDDDYLQRNEDLIFRDLIEYAGGKYTRVSETFHYHQVMNRRGETEPDFISVTAVKKEDPEWEKRIFNMQAKGIIKYLKPEKKYLIKNVNFSIRKLYQLECLDWNDFRLWVKQTNPIWLNYIVKPNSMKLKLVNFILKIGKRIIGRKLEAF